MGRFTLESLLESVPDGQLIFVGSLACTRHRGFEMGKLMREKRMSLLCPSATDFATGRYINLIIDGIREVAEERGADTFVLMHGCQCALLSTDYDLVKEELSQYDIKLMLHDTCHLCMTEEDLQRKHGMGGRECVESRVSIC